MRLAWFLSLVMMATSFVISDRIRESRTHVVSNLSMVSPFVVVDKIDRIAHQAPTQASLWICV